MTRPPSGMPPPTSATLDGEVIELMPLAEAVADRYFDEFPEDLERYGEAARPWEIHDTLHTFNWAILDVRGFTNLETNMLWLARVLVARDFPLEHLARNVELCADVVADERLATVLRAAVVSVRGYSPDD
ncbi:hypothetical protein OM076_22680 [Solirubrobacter ginsenosidimutans]|uniref:Uncharacterized protein n=1 Tax=Solirubrobacter ginsenosidimutans TaxID=490573 RepID=A0A9X3S355_9ACTN|nr:hypothetical protein [Solirubrobacter ginsenosidimutans]MDA0163097.1 hypothetical protein [Solirubrobacter ginsenosidimutans]